MEIFLLLRIFIDHGRMKRDSVWKLPHHSADTGSPVLVDRTDLCPDGPQLEGNILARDDSEDIGIVHEVIGISAIHERMPESHHAIAVDIGDRPDSAELEIACHHGCRDGTSRFKRLRHIILRGRCGSKGDHVEILHFPCEEIHRIRGVSTCHERRRKRDQPFGGWRGETRVLPVIDGPELQHVTDRRHHADAPAGLWKSIRHCAQQFPIDIDRTAAHPLRDAFCLIDQGPGYFHQHQISAGRALAFHNPQHVDIEGFNLRTMNDCLGIAMHTLLYF